MRVFKALEIAGVLHDLAILSTAIEAEIHRTNGAMELVDPANIASAIEDATRAVAACSDNPGFASALVASTACLEGLTHPTRKITFGELQIMMDTVSRAIWFELRRDKAVLIPRRYASYVDASDLFGEEVSTCFPEAVDDIRDAGNCIAVELPSAAVFHLMRVAEFGLRRLGKTVAVKLTDKGKPVAIEYADWTKVITGVRNSIDEKRKLPAGSKKAKLLDALSRSVDQCEYFKDIWRNEVSHTRTRYNLSEAEGVLERVKDFMQALTRL